MPRKGNQKPVAVQARAFGWSAERFIEVMNQISDRFVKHPAATVVELIELFEARRQFLKNVQKLPFGKDYPVSDLDMCEKHWIRVAKLNLSLLSKRIEKEGGPQLYF